MAHDYLIAIQYVYECVVVAYESDNATAVLHPTGRPITPADLPSNGIRRWTSMRKAEVIACVRAGLITPPEACERYMLSEEELLSWSRYLNKHGVSALRATRVQDYRIRTGLGG